MAKQPGRRDRDGTPSLRIAAYVLLVGGLALIIAGMVSTATRIEAAGDGLLLIGWPLFILGCVLKGLDWMSSYTAAAEGSWDHHVNPPPGRGGAPNGRRSAKRLRLFGSSEQFSDFALSVPDEPLVQPLPAGTWAHHAGNHAGNPAATSGAARQAAQPAVPAGPSRPAAADAAAANRPPTRAPARPDPIPEPEPEEMPAYLSRVDPGPDTVIEEFVGYEGQDRMLAVRETAPPPPPRALAWPHPPRQAVDVSPAGNEAFLGKLMDDVMAKLGTADAAAALPAATALSPAHAPAPAPAPTPTPTPPAARVAAATPFAAPAPPAPAAPLVWTRQSLQRADHWRFAALVEKLYQQAGFATQLQAGQTMRGVVVLWLFSRHRPGMPASVVSCVHAPTGTLALEEITAVAELVKARDLPRGQLATTAHVDEAGLKLAAAHSVHLMDCDRLLQLIGQRSPEQQRALADRLA